MVDMEEEYYPEEIAKLEQDVKEGLGLIVFGEWYNVDTMVKMRFFDDNTRSWWTPVTGDAGLCPCSCFSALERGAMAQRSTYPLHARCFHHILRLILSQEYCALWLPACLAWMHLQPAAGQLEICYRATLTPAYGVRRHSN